MFDCYFSILPRRSPFAAICLYIFSIISPVGATECAVYIIDSTGGRAELKAAAEAEAARIETNISRWRDSLPTSASSAHDVSSPRPAPIIVSKEYLQQFSVPEAAQGAITFDPSDNRARIQLKRLDSNKVLIPFIVQEGYPVEKEKSRIHESGVDFEATLVEECIIAVVQSDLKERIRGSEASATSALAWAFACKESANRFGEGMVLKALSAFAPNDPGCPISLVARREILADLCRGR